MTDLGSIQIVRKRERENGTEYTFEGLFSDLSKLQTATTASEFKNMSTGSTCLLYNPTSVYKYNASTKTWIAL